MNKFFAYGGWGAALVLGAMLLFREDDNAHPRYGEKTNLPANCHAYVDTAIAGYRSNRYSIDETLAGLERNCGAGGALWKRH